ncbi:cation channel sperm-associated auxiliary subunit beta-like isoform X2 [Asterias amurensis]
MDTRSIGHGFSSMGLAPSVTLKNTTWIRTLHFPLDSWNITLGVWQFVSSKEEIFTAHSGSEAWTALVSLDTSTQFLQTATSLLDLTQVSIVNTKLGDPMVAAGEVAQPSLLVDSAASLHSATAPCSPDIAVLGLVYNTTSEAQGIVIGVTLKNFEMDENSTHWYNVTAQLCQLVSLSDCEEVTLLDLVLTADPSLLLLTTHGLFLGQLPNDDLSDDSTSSIETFAQGQVSWSEIDLDNSISYSSFHLVHTPVCHDSYYKSSTDQEAYVIMIGNESSEKGIFLSSSPYSNWTISPPSSILSQSQNLLYDHHTDSFVALHQTKASKSVRTFSASQLLDGNASNRSHYPPFQLPVTFYPAHGQAMCLHPTEHEIFVYGNQVWLSNDGGNQFDLLLTLDSNQTIEHCYVDLHGGKVVFTSNTHKVYYRSAGVRKIIEVSPTPLPDDHGQPQPALQSLAVHFTHTGSATLLGITKLNPDLWVQEINLSTATQLSSIAVKSALSVQLMTDSKVILYEVISTVDSVLPTPLRILTQQASAGKQLNQRDIGRAIITDAVPEFQVPSYSIAVARAIVFTKFEEETWRDRPEFKNTVELVRYNGATVWLILQLDKDGPGWHCGDVGKTLAMPYASSILILSCHNHTHSKGLALLSNMIKHFYPAKSWSLFDLRPYQNHADVINQTLSIDGTTNIACLQQEGRFQFDQRHLNMTLEVSNGHAIVTHIIDESCCKLKRVTGSIAGLIVPGGWGLYKTKSGGKVEQFTVTEPSCQHYLTPDPNASKYPVRHLDVGDSFSFSVTATFKGKRFTNEPLMYFRVANPSVISVSSNYVKDKHGSEKILMTVKNRLYGKGSSAVTFNLPEASLACTRTSFTLTFKATCPPTKHLHYVYEPQLTQQELLYGAPKDNKERPVLTDIPVNYRPPSPLGISIPTSYNVYNADPGLPRPRDIYQISKDTGVYKQCHGKASRADCGCTDAMKLSSLERYTDCRQRAYRLLHPGKLALKFHIVEDEKKTVELGEPYVITLNEVNGRADYIVEGESNPSLDKISSDLTSVILNESQLIDPSTVKLILTGSGLYHFRATVIQGFSYCRLQDEVQVYIDMAPLPNPTQMIVIAVTSVVIGGVLFSVYLYYLHSHHRTRIRKIGSKCMDPHGPEEHMHATK